MKILTNGLFKILITIFLTLIILIAIKASNSFKNKFYKRIYDTSFSFSKINKLYNTYFGKIIPSSDLEVIKPVFNESLNYTSKKKYLDGVSLSINNDYLVPSISDGVVVYIGNKENYGNVIIVNDSNGVDIWYGNMDSIDLKLYDYVKKGTYLGRASKNLYMVFKQDGNVIDYEKYL